MFRGWMRGLSMESVGRVVGRGGMGGLFRFLSVLSVVKRDGRIS